MNSAATGADGPAGDPDRVVYTPVHADLLAANRLIHRPTRRRVATYAVVTALGVAEIVLALSSPPADRTLFLVAGVALVLVAPVWRAFLSLWLLPRHVRRYHAQAAILREEFTVSWSEAGLASRTRRTSSLVPWEDYVGRREDDATLLFFQTDALFQFLPRRVLTPEQLARLRLLAGAVPERRWQPLWPRRRA